MVRITPDHRYAFYNTPGGAIGFTWDYTLKVLDLQTLEVVAEMETSTSFNDTLPLHYLPTHWMEVSPDSRWLVLLDAQSRIATLLFDIHKMELVDYVQFGSGVGNLTAWTKP
jgi:hypothetical protein